MIAQLRKTILILLPLAFICLGAAAQTISPETLAKRAKRKNLTVKEWNTTGKGSSKWLDHINFNE